MAGRRSKKTSEPSHDDGATKPLQSPTRRVVKATPPPPPSPQEVGIANELVVDVGLVDVNRIPPILDPTVEHEVEEEQREKWRRQRLEAASVQQRKHRDEEIDELRKGQRRKKQENRNSSSDLSDIAETTTSTNFAYSVEPAFPDHKRTVETASLPRSRPLVEPLDKRAKTSETPDETEEENRDKSLFENENNEHKKWNWNQVVPAVAVCVVVLFVADRFWFRRRK